MIKKIIILTLLVIILFVSCSDNVVKPPPRGIIYGSVLISIPTIYEDGRQGVTKNYPGLIDGLKIIATENGKSDTTYTVKDKYFLSTDYGVKFLKYYVNDTIMGFLSEITYTINKDSIMAFDYFITPRKNSDSTLFELEFPSPQPAQNSFTNQYIIQKTGIVEINIIDIKNNIIKKVVKEIQKPGQYLYSIDEFIKPGLYFIFAKYNNQAWSYAAFVKK